MPAPRWTALADAWEPMAEDAYYAFNDVHAMMAFSPPAGQGRPGACCAALERRGPAERHQRGDDAGRRPAGRPGDRRLRPRRLAGAIDILLPVRTIAHRFGGSHAQRDLLGMTLIEAALRTGETGSRARSPRSASALKPGSPFSGELVRRAQEGLKAEHGRQGRRRRRSASITDCRVA